MEGMWVNSDSLDTAAAQAQPSTPMQPLQTLPEQRTAWRVMYGLAGGALGLAVGWALAVALAALGGRVHSLTAGWWAVALVSGLVFAAAGLWVAQQRYARYRVQYHPLAGVCLYDGVWWETETWVPIARLQHLDVQQGPLDRRWGMATLSLHTAGTHDHVLRIRGLPLAQAHALRAALLPQLHSHHV